MTDRFDLLKQAWDREKEAEQAWHRAESELIRVRRERREAQRLAFFDRPVTNGDHQ